MADEAKAADPAEDPPAAKGSGSLKWMIIAALASLASAGGTFLVVSRSATQVDAAAAAAPGAKAADEHGEPPKDAEAEPATEEPAKQEHGADEHAEKAQGDAHAAAPSDAPSMFTMETFVVNINDGERDRFLKLKPELELTASAVTDELKANMPQVKDSIISLLSSQSFSQIRSVEGKDLLREELMVRLNAMLKSGKVSRIFFTEFVVQ